MKKSLFIISLILLFLASSATSAEAIATPDPNRPSTPPNEPTLQPPYNDPGVYLVSGYGLGFHTDNNSQIKTYYAQDFEKKGSDGFPVSFDLVADAAGTVQLYTGPAHLSNGDAQISCPVDSDTSTTSPDGQGLFLNHGNGWYSFYFHMASISVTNGQRVNAGDPVGTAGCTGANTIHLHFDVRWHDTVKNIWWDYPTSFASPPAGPAVDLAFAIDTTSSMSDDIADVKSAASDIVDMVHNAAPDSRIAVLDFRDFPERTGASYDYPYQDDLPFTRSMDDAKQAINALSLGYGGDGPETRNCALMHAFRADRCAGKGAATTIGTWRPIATKFLIYLTDAPALSPEPYTNYTNSGVAAAANARGFEVLGSDGDMTGYPDVLPPASAVAVYPIVVGGDPSAIADADELAIATGGSVFTAPDASGVAQAIKDAVQAIVSPPAVSSIVRDGQSPTIAANVNFAVSFSKPVIGVDPGDFSLTANGVLGAFVTGVSGAHSHYTVSVNTGVGNGTIRLDLPASATITDLDGSELSNLPFVDGETYTIQRSSSSFTARSIGAQDGWILEAREYREVGGSKDNASMTFNIGDDVFRRQYRAFLSFNTVLPNGAVVTSATLRIRNAGLTGKNPYLTLGNIVADIKSGSFSDQLGLQVRDFQAPSSSEAVLTMPYAPLKAWFSGTLDTSALGDVNTSGFTQFRLRFQVDDNNNRVANFLRFYSGNTIRANRPQLIITYYVP